MFDVRQPPGKVRDAIVDHLSAADSPQSLDQILAGVRARLGEVASSSVRSYLGLNAGSVFERTSRAVYSLPYAPTAATEPIPPEPAFTQGKATMFQSDCVAWLKAWPERSIQGVVTDPPFGLVEYSEDEITKRGEGRGVWRLPPAYAALEPGLAHGFRGDDQEAPAEARGEARRFDDR